ncbi:hypothetical protein E2651_07735 [Streptomyces sp. MZ04]|nr:hypothetical protein E2651_07735 [Streptomyces sp. MZ04]
MAEAALVAVRYEASVPRLLAEHEFGPDNSVTGAAVAEGRWERCDRCGYTGAPASMRNHEKKPHKETE